MADLIRYPRGFTSSSPNTYSKNQQLVVDSPGDDVVWALYRLYVSRGVPNADVITWEFQKMVVQTAARLFGKSFREWAMYQALANEGVYGFNYKFILDTIRYISTGERMMRVPHWCDYMLDNPDTLVGCATPARENEVFNALKAFGPDTNVIQLWCTQANGFSDMLETLFTLFGKAHKPDGIPSAHAAGAPIINILDKSTGY